MERHPRPPALPSPLAVTAHPGCRLASPGTFDEPTVITGECGEWEAGDLDGRRPREANIIRGGPRAPNDDGES